MTVTGVQATGAHTARLSLHGSLGRWIGLVPFFLFALAFMLLPAGVLLVGAFQDPQGGFTLVNLGHLFRPNILHSYLLTIEVSLVTALGGALFGFLLAYAVTLGGLSRGVRNFIVTFSGVAS